MRNDIKRGYQGVLTKVSNYLAKQPKVILLGTGTYPI
jgi:hypothetical protein